MSYLLKKPFHVDVTADFEVKLLLILPTLAPVQILEGMPMTEQVEELLLVLGPFYELVDEKKKKISQISDLSTGAFVYQLEPVHHIVCDVRYVAFNL